MRSVVLALGAIGAACLMSAAASAEDLTWCKAAIASQESKDYDQAIAEINKCIDTGSLQDGNLAIALHNRGIAFVDIERAEEAVEDFTASLRLRPEHPNTYFRRAHAMHVLGNLDAAIVDYTAVLRLDPNDHGAYLYRGAAWHDLGQFARAVEDYSFALKIDPSDAGAYYARSKAYESLGLTELAEKDRKASLRN
jgi:tetratricopeptide (TPR) repeat protein